MRVPGDGGKGGRGPSRAAGRRGALVRSVVAGLVMLGCLAAVVAFQVTRPAQSAADSAVFVPSPKFFKDLSPSFRTAVADAYWLAMIQYYGEHVEGDRQLDSLPAYVRLVTDLSPRFERAYLFGAFALLDAGKGQEAYELLVRGARRNPESWQIPATLGMLIYTYADNPAKDKLAAEWYEKAAAVPGSPDYIPRVAAELLTKGGEEAKSALMWGQVYATGDTYARDKALVELDELLPRDPQQRKEALQPLAALMTPQQFLTLSSILMGVLETP